jgi:putative phage-type endonuclease
MGINPWKHIYTLWLEKTGQIDDSVPVNSHMQRGIDNEERARIMVSGILGLELYPAEVQHPQYAHLRASLDATDVDNTTVVEIKCPTRENHLKIKQSGVVPPIYACQIQHQLMVTGAKHGYYFGYEAETGDHFLTAVNPDESFISEMFHAENRFWDAVCSRTPPCDPPAGCTSYTQNSTQEFAKLAVEYIYLDEQIKDLEKSKDRIKDILKALANGMPTRGGGISISFQQRTTLDRDALARVIDISKFEVKKEPYAVIKIL